MKAWVMAAWLAVLAPTFVASAGPPATTSAVSVTPVVGAGWTSEDYIPGRQAQVFAGLDLEIRPLRSHAFLGSFRAHFYQREYLTDRVDPLVNGPARLTAAEQKWDASLLYAWEFVQAPGPRPRVTGEFLLGGAFRRFHNEAIPAAVLGPSGGARFGFALSRRLQLTILAVYTYNLLTPQGNPPTLLGEPRGAIQYGGALGMRFGSGWRVRLGYEGETIPMGRSYRYYHGLTMLVDISL